MKFQIGSNKEDIIRGEFNMIEYRIAGIDEIDEAFEVWKDFQ